MTGIIIDGKALAAGTHAATQEQITLLAKRGVAPCLAILLVGDHEASRIYVTNKLRAAKRVGMATRLIERAATATTADILSTLQQVAADKTVHGVIVQMPLPAHIDTNAVLAVLPPAKDVDGLSPTNLGNLFIGQDCFVPATPQGCLMLIKSVMPTVRGLNAVVVGRSRLVGKPVAQLLLAEDCTVTMAHSRTADMPAICRTADVLVAAAGRAGLIRGDWIKKGATVIDVGITRQDGRLVGDVDFESAVKVAGAITPVPGGVGPMTIACLLRNTVYACAKQHGIDLTA